MGWVIFLLVIIVLILLLGSEGFGRLVGGLFIFALVVIGVVIFIAVLA